MKQNNSGNRIIYRRIGGRVVPIKLNAREAAAYTKARKDRSKHRWAAGLTAGGGYATGVAGIRMHRKQMQLKNYPRHTEKGMKFYNRVAKKLGGAGLGDVRGRTPIPPTGEVFVNLGKKIGIPLSRDQLMQKKGLSPGAIVGNYGMKYDYDVALGKLKSSRLKRFTFAKKYGQIQDKHLAKTYKMLMGSHPKQGAVVGELLKMRAKQATLAPFVTAEGYRRGLAIAKKREGVKGLFGFAKGMARKKGPKAMIIGGFGAAIAGPIWAKRRHEKNLKKYKKEFVAAGNFKGRL